MKTIHTILFIFGATLSSLALADEYGTDSKDFESHLQNPYQSTRIYDRDQNIWLPNDMYASLSSIAFEQAQIWADTILEGDYHAAGDTRLDQVEALYQNEIIVGYRIIYSEQAWDLSQCSYYKVPEDERGEALKTCPYGRILEASFVSPPLTTFIRDEDQLADFSPQGE